MRIHHLALRTSDVPRLTAFYRDVVGLETAPDARPPEALSAWLSAGTTRVMVEPRDADEPGVPAGSMELVAFTIDPTERDRFERRLATAGVTVEQRTGFTLYFRDPDGRRVAVSHYPDPAGAQAP